MAYTQIVSVGYIAPLMTSSNNVAVVLKWKDNCLQVAGKPSLLNSQVQHNVNQLAQAVVYLICIVSGSDITSYFNNRLETLATKYVKMYPIVDYMQSGIRYCPFKMLTEYFCE